MKTSDAIIAGAGIIGVSLGLELRRRGMSVLVLERAQPGREASSAAAGMLAATDPETPKPLKTMAMESARLFPSFVAALEELSNMTVDFRRHGTVALLAAVHHVPDTYQPLSTTELLKLEPAVRAGDLSTYLVEEDSVDPALLMKAALAAAQHRLMTVSPNKPVTEVRTSGGAVNVQCADDKFSCGFYIDCRGSWSGAPVRPRKGQMLYLQPVGQSSLQHVVRAPKAYIVPRTSGSILVGATVEDVGFDKSVDPKTIAELHRAAAEIVPSLGPGNVTSSWAGLRPGTPDDLPLMGETAPHCFIASGHFRNGILLAPVTARLMASLIFGESPDLDLAPFSPQRFSMKTR